MKSLFLKRYLISDTEDLVDDRDLSCHIPLIDSLVRHVYEVVSALTDAISDR
jgi:hypothetical protein